MTLVKDPSGVGQESPLHGEAGGTRASGYETGYSPGRVRLVLLDDADAALAHLALTPGEALTLAFDLADAARKGTP